MRTEREIAAAVNAAAQRSDHVALIELATEAEELATDVALGIAFNARGIAASKTSEYEIAKAHLYRALDYAQRANKPGLVASIRNNIGSVQQHLGDYDGAHEHFQISFDMASSIGDTSAMSLALGNLGILCASRGEYAEALGFMTRGLEIEQASGDEVGAATSLGNMGIVYYRMGDLATALTHYQRALDANERIGNAWGVALNTGNIGTAYVGIGDYVLAADYFRRAIPLHEALGNVSSVARVNGNLGVALRESGDLDGSRTCLARSFQMHRDLGNSNEMYHSASQLVSTLLAMEDPAAARQILAELDGRMPGDPRTRSLVLTNHGLVCKAEGDLDAALGYLREALTLAEEIGAAEIVMSLHMSLRELAEARRDLDAYVHHNARYLAEKERVSGRDVTSRIATLSAERTIALERAEREKERAVLHSTLPKHIVERVIRGDDVSGDLIDDAAILFLDIVGFTAKSASMAPKDLTRLLSTIFTTLDGIVQQFDVLKVKTIGDAYMAAALPHTTIFGVESDTAEKERAPSSVQRAAQVACLMQRTSFTWPDGERIAYRIGVHVGPVVAGVLGSDRLQYDVWGDTVNTASRLETTGEPGRIHVSGQFAQALNGESGFVLTQRGEVVLRGKGVMMTYWLAES